jgi:urease accessory protein
MLRATAVIRKAAVKPDRVADTAWLDHDARQSRRLALRAHGGLEFQLDLDRATALNDGDAVKLEDGRLVQVRAAPQQLLEIRAENPARLVRLAWHLGGAHVPAEFHGDAVYVEVDPAVAELARGQGCRVGAVTRPFQPERSEEHVCTHDHHGHGHHGHGHDHAHDHHGHGHGHDHHGQEHHGRDQHGDHDHEHGPACGHGHKHEH